MFEHIGANVPKKLMKYGYGMKMVIQIYILGFVLFRFLRFCHAFLHFNFGIVIYFFQLCREKMPIPPVNMRPELVDDFVRNFLVKMGMTRSLDCFQTEW